MKKTLITLAISLLLITNVYGDNIRLHINGMPVHSKVSPVLEAETTLVPLRIIGENLGAKIAWDGPSQTVTVNKKGKEIKLSINSQIVWVNNVEEQLLAAPRLIKGTTMVPIRFISESLDIKVEWDASSRTVFITSDEGLDIPESEEGLLLEGAGLEFIALDGYSINRGQVIDMEVNLNSKGKKATFFIKWGHPNVVSIAGTLGGYGQNFYYDIEMHEAFDGYGDIVDGYYAQINCYDLDGDGNKEILVSVGDKRSQIETLIYNTQSNNPEKPFKLVGRILAEGYMYTDVERDIVVPYTSQGLDKTYRYRNGQLFQVD